MIWASFSPLFWLSLLKEGRSGEKEASWKRRNQGMEI